MRLALSSSKASHIITASCTPKRMRCRFFHMMHGSNSPLAFAAVKSMRGRPRRSNVLNEPFPSLPFRRMLHRCDGQPAFCRGAKPGALWACLVEKAVAKRYATPKTEWMELEKNFLAALLEDFLELIATLGAPGKEAKEGEAPPPPKPVRSRGGKDSAKSSPNPRWRHI